jgi:hypothetical protein
MKIFSLNFEFDLERLPENDRANFGDSLDGVLYFFFSQNFFPFFCIYVSKIWLIDPPHVNFSYYFNKEKKNLNHKK